MERSTEDGSQEMGRIFSQEHLFLTYQFFQRADVVAIAAFFPRSWSLFCCKAGVALWWAGVNVEWQHNTCIYLYIYTCMYICMYISAWKKSTTVKWVPPWLRQAHKFRQLNCLFSTTHRLCSMCATNREASTKHALGTSFHDLSCGTAFPTKNLARPNADNTVPKWWQDFLYQTLYTFCMLFMALTFWRTCIVWSVFRWIR